MEGDINQLNPADVENVSILKDAAASSIYGSRAAGGVILITTRQGKEGKVTVNYSDSFRWSKALGLPKFANSWEWAVTMNEAAANNGSGWFSQAYLDKLKAVVDDPSLATMFVNPTNNHWEVWDETDILPIANTDWMEEHFGTTPSRRNTTSASPEVPISTTTTSPAISYRRMVRSATARTTCSATHSTPRSMWPSPTG